MQSALLSSAPTVLPCSLQQTRSKCVCTAINTKNRTDSSRPAHNSPENGPKPRLGWVDTEPINPEWSRSGDVKRSLQDKREPSRTTTGHQNSQHNRRDQQDRKEKQKQKREAAKVTRISNHEAMQRKKGCCYGCGAKLQIEVPLGPGYVSAEKYEQKAKHKQLDQILCARCAELCNGAMIPAVEDFTQKLQAQVLRDQGAASEESLELLGKSLVSPEQLRTQLMEVSTRKAVVVMLVDLTDASGTLMTRVRDMVGKNPIILVGTKMDLLPESSHPREVAEWLTDAAARKGLSVVSCHLVSSHSGEGLSPAVGKICRERKGRDVYVVGAANVGKSAFVRAMLKEMGKFEGGNFDAAAMANGRFLPVESPMPGTTLGIIPLKAFESGGTLYDTPGVHLHHRVPHMLSPEELKLLHPRKRLQPLLPPTPLMLTQQQQQKEQDEDDDSMYDEAVAADGQTDDLPGFDWTGEDRLSQLGNKKKKKEKLPAIVSGSYSWSDLVRIDVVDGPPSTALAFYGPSSMRVKAQPLTQETTVPSIAATVLQRDAGNTATSTTATDVSPSDAGVQEGPSSGSSGKARILNCAQSVSARGGLIPHLLTVKVDGTKGPLADIAVSGVPGWAAVWAPLGKRNIRLRVWIPRGVEVFLRPPLPGESPFRAQQEDDEEEADIDMEGGQLDILASEYEGGGAATSINDASWWEAAIAELEGVDMGDDDEEEVKPRPRRGLGGSRRLRRQAVDDSDEDDDTEGVVMQATVEDILKRPRLDIAFGQGDEEDEDEDLFEEEEEEDASVSRRARARPRFGLRGRRAVSKKDSNSDEAE